MFMQFVQLYQYLLLEQKNGLKVLTQGMVTFVSMTITPTFNFHLDLIAFKLLIFVSCMKIQGFSLHRSLLLILQLKCLALKISVRIFLQFLGNIFI